MNRPLLCPVCRLPTITLGGEDVCPGDGECSDDVNDGDTDEWNEETTEDEED